MIILVDQDEVLTQFSKAVLTQWREKYPDKPYVPLENLTEHLCYHNYPPECTPALKAIYGAEGFFSSLEPVPGSIEALKEMADMGHDVSICSSPITDYKNCVSEKYQWVEKHLGMEWTGKLILTKDKTLVKGNILIDDKPHVTGVARPEWEHIVYDMPYNRKVKDKLRMASWDNWKEVLNCCEIMSSLSPYL